MSARPGVAVIIPSFRGAARIGATLRALAADAPGAEVVVVDDGSDDDTLTAARAAGVGLDLRVERHAVNRGRAAACNTGLRVATSGWAWILDDDMQLEPGAAAAMGAAWEAPGAPERAFLGRIRLPDDLEDSPFTAFLRHEEADRHRKLLRDRERVPWPNCLTGNFCARREALLALGGFDERITLYGFEDIELGIRLHRAGLRLTYLPEAASLHHAYATGFARLRERTYLSGKVAPYVAEAHRDDPEVRAFLRLDGMGAVSLRRDSAFLVAMKLWNRLLRRPRALARRSSPGGERFLGTVIDALERLPVRRLRHLAYHLVRDVSYYRGIADAGEQGAA